MSVIVKEMATGWTLVVAREVHVVVRPSGLIELPDIVRNPIQPSLVADIVDALEAAVKVADSRTTEVAS